MSASSVVRRGYKSAYLLYVVTRGFFQSPGNAPVSLGEPSANYDQNFGSGSTVEHMSAYFTNAPTSYSATGVPVGGAWAFNTTTGDLTIDTSTVGAFGPITVTAINATGSTPGNAFTINVVAPGGESYRGLGWRSGIQSYK